MSDRATRRPDGPPVSAARKRRTRVRVIVGLFVVAVVTSALVGWQFARETTPVTGPIVLISIDPLRADRLGAYGRGSTLTPHLDRLAAGATVFTQASSHAAASLPAHVSLLTGLLPFNHGVRDNVGFTLDGDAETLASRLADRGFETAAAVSTFLLRPQTGLGTGFAHYDAERPEPPAERPRAAVERENAATAKAATTWLDEQDSARFFYALQLNGAVPAVPGAQGAHATRTGSDAVVLAAADAAVRSVLDALRRKGWYNDALVVVTSTYGGPPDGTDDPGRGFTLAAPVIRVPFLVKMPGDAEPQHIEAPLQHIDVAPTLLNLVRAPGSSALRGRSFRALLEGDTEAPVETPRYAEAMAGALRFGWAELVEPADGTFRSSVGAAVPTPAADADRDALARLGEVAPTLLPVTDAAAVRPDPRAMGHVLARYRQAAWFEATRAFADAITEYRRVVDAAPGDANARYRLGIVAARLGRVDEAVAALDAAATLRPGLGDAALAAALVQLEAGLLDEAASRGTAILETLVPAVPADVRAAAHHVLASVAAARKRPDDARAQAALAEQALASVPYVRFVDGRLLHDQDRCETALPAFDAVVTALEDRARLDGLHWLRGDCLARLDRHPEALEAFERAVADAPFDLRVHRPGDVAARRHPRRRGDGHRGAAGAGGADATGLCRGGAALDDARRPCSSHAAAHRSAPALRRRAGPSPAATLTARRAISAHAAASRGAGLPRSSGRCSAFPARGRGPGASSPAPRRSGRPAPPARRG